MHVCDNTFCPMHQRNDNRTYGRINLEISPNLRVYNFKLKDREAQFDLDPKLKNFFYFLYLGIISVNFQCIRLQCAILDY